MRAFRIIAAALLVSCAAAPRSGRSGESPARAGPARRYRRTPEFQLVIGSVAPDAVSVELQVYDRASRGWRKCGEFELEREGDASPGSGGGPAAGGRAVFIAPREGEHFLRAAARDRVGNVDSGRGPGDADLVAVYDRTPPAIAITSPAAGTSFAPGEKMRLAWRTAEAHPLRRRASISLPAVTVELSTDGGRTWRRVADAAEDTGEMVVTAPAAPAAPAETGGVAFRLAVLDACGNVGRSAPRAFEVGRSRSSRRDRRTSARARARRVPRLACPAVSGTASPALARGQLAARRQAAGRLAVAHSARARTGPAARSSTEKATPEPVSEQPRVPDHVPPHADAPARPAGGVPKETDAAEPEAAKAGGRAPSSSRAASEPGAAEAGEAAPAPDEAAAQAVARARRASEAYTRGAAALAAGRVDEAAGLFCDALEADRSIEAAWLDLSTALVGSKRGGALRSAERALAEAGRLFPKNADFPFNRGLVLVKLGRAEEAKAEIERACALKPGLVEAHWTLARFAVDAEDLVTACAHWREVVRSAKEGSPLRVRAEELLEAIGAQPEE